MLNKATVILFSLFCISSLSINGQVIINVNDYSILYREYPNELNLGFYNSFNDSISLKCEECDSVLRMSDKPATFKVYPSKYCGRCDIIIYNEIADSVINVKTFQAMTLPKPIIKYGSCHPDCRTPYVMSRIFVHYNQRSLSHIYVRWKIKFWKVEFNDLVFEGTGNNLSDDLLNELKNLDTETKIKITVNYYQEDFKDNLKTTFNYFTILGGSDQKEIPKLEYSGNCE